MQSQNQRMFSKHGRAIKRFTDLEARLQSDTLRRKLEERVAELSKLNKERKYVEIKIEKLVQRRDCVSRATCQTRQHHFGAPSRKN